jgi:hypothetical protein
MSVKPKEVREARAVARRINSEDGDEILSPVDWHVFAGHAAPPASSPMAGPPEAKPQDRPTSPQKKSEGT